MIGRLDVYAGFNPRTPCGVRQPHYGYRRKRGRFQSTHSLRSATQVHEHGFVPGRVSIHALLAECDGVECPQDAQYFRFQSTHSLRSATPTGELVTMMETVSIHALLAECDGNPRTTKILTKSFNPRTPCGVRRNRLYTLLLNRANHTLRQPP